MRISLTALRAFEATARHSSMSLAASELRVGLASISRLVSALQARLGVELLCREGRRVALTPASRAYFAEITAAFRSITLATESVSRQDGLGLASLTIASERAFAHRWLLPRLAQFRVQMPKLALRVVGTDQPAEAGAMPDISLGWRAAGADATPEEVVLCEPPLLALASPTIVSAPLPALLRGAPLVHNRTPELWRQWLSLAGYSGEVPQPGIVMPDKEMAMAAAAGGLGVALGCQLLAGEEMESGRCRQVLPETFVLGRYVATLHHRSSTDPALTGRFLSWLQGEMVIAKKPSAAWPPVSRAAAR